MTLTKLGEMNMSILLTEAYELSEMINHSAEVADYLYWKQIMEQDEQVQAAIRSFEQAKVMFQEAERFGHFHPNYHEAMETASEKEKELNRFEVVQRFKQAEEALDELLHDISKTIAFAVSEQIKVPSNKLVPESGGCGAGGSCSGNCS